MTSGSAVSTSNVCSWLTDLAATSGVTGEGSIPSARSCRVAPWAPSRRTRTSTGSAARSPIVRTPWSASAARVCSPTPHRRVIGSGREERRLLAGRTTTSPSGLRRSEATLATSFVVATPTLAVSPTSSRTAALIRRAIASGGPNSASDPATSRNASSIETCSRSGVKRPRISMTRRLSRRYFAPVHRQEDAAAGSAPRPFAGAGPSGRRTRGPRSWRPRRPLGRRGRRRR